MASGTQIASAYVKIMPSFEGMRKEVNRALTAAVNGATLGTTKLGQQLGQSVGKNVHSALNNAMAGVDTSAMTTGLNKGLQNATGNAGKSMKSGLESATRGTGQRISSEVKGAFSTLGSKLGPVLTAPAKAFSATFMATAPRFGNALKSAINGAAKTAMTGVAASAIAVGGQVAAGGFKRATTLNNANAKLKALGYEGEKLKSIMDSAAQGVENTSYSLGESASQSAMLLASGIKPGKELTAMLKNISKLSDMSGRSFSDMGQMMGKMAAAGIVQAEELNQVSEAGIPIYQELAKQYGINTLEVKKMASEGKISFQDMNKAITNLRWDTGVFSSNDLTSSFANLRTSMSKFGQKFWDPIVIGLVPVMNTLKDIINKTTASMDFTKVENKISDFMKKIQKRLEVFKNADGSINTDLIKQKIDELTKSFTDFYERIKSLKGPLIGLLVGLGGQALSGIPVIGPAFAALTPIVGIFAGTLVTAYNASENLQGVVKGLGDRFLYLGNKISTAFTGKGINFADIGDTVAAGITSVMDFIDDAVDGIITRKDELSDVFGELGKTISGIFGNGGFSGKAFGSFLSDAVIVITNIIKTGVEIGKSVGAFLSSQETKDFIGGIINFIRPIVENEQMIKTFLAIGAAVFVAGKMLAIVKSIAGVLGAIQTIGGSFKGGAAAGNAVGSAISGVAGGMSKAANGIDLKGIGKLGVAIGMIVGTIGLMGLMGKKFADGGAVEGLVYIGQMIQTIADVIGSAMSRMEIVIPLLIAVGLALAGPVVETLSIGLAKVMLIGTAFAAGITLIAAIFGGIGKLFKEWDLMSGWQYLADAINLGVDTVLNVIDGIADVFMEHLGKFVDIVGTFMIDAAAAIALAVPPINNLLKTLAENGSAAGSGALQASYGIGALAAALLALSGGNFVANGVDKVGKLVTGGDDPVQKLQSTLDLLIRSTDAIEVMAGRWESSLKHATEFGQNLPLRIADGVDSRRGELENRLGTLMNDALGNTQRHLDAHPLTVRVKVDTSAMRRVTAGNTGGGLYGMKNIYNRTNNYNANVGSDSLRTLIRSAR